MHDPHENNFICSFDWNIPVQVMLHRFDFSWTWLLWTNRYWIGSNLLLSFCFSTKNNEFYLPSFDSLLVKRCFPYITTESRCSAQGWELTIASAFKYDHAHGGKRESPRVQSDACSTIERWSQDYNMKTTSRIVALAMNTYGKWFEVSLFLHLISIIRSLALLANCWRGKFLLASVGYEMKRNLLGVCVLAVAHQFSRQPAWPLWSGV